MVFSSVAFLFFFLPVVLGIGLLMQAWVNRRGGAGLPLRLANTWLLAASLVFYAWGELRLLWVLVVSGLLSFAGGLVVERAKGRARIGLLAVFVASNLGLLVWFKYSGLLADLLRKFGGAVSWPAVALPLGISFFTFHGLSYVVDVYRGKVAPTRSLLDFGCYFVLFPQLVAGPIVRFSEVAAAYVRRVTTLDDIAEGARRFAIGLAKKVLIANQVAVLADAAFALPADDRTAGAAWLGAIAYALQIFYDFSGYSDMALGLGRMLGFAFPENFDRPYLARSMREFWRRWHMTLSRFFRDYLYIPLGGNRHGAARTALNLVLVFALCGWWHGAAWTVLAWGLFHGAFLAAERVLEAPLARAPAWSRPLGHLYVLAVVLVSWVLFRCETWPQASAYLGALADWRSLADLAALPWRALAPDVTLALLAGILCCLPLGDWWSEVVSRHRAVGALRAPLATIVPLALLAACLLAIGAGSHDPFIYFRF